MKKEQKSMLGDRASRKPRASKFERAAQEEEKVLNIFSDGAQPHDKFNTSFERQMAAEIEDVYRANVKNQRKSKRVSRTMQR